MHLQARLLRKPVRRYDRHSALLPRCFSFLGGQECCTVQEFVSDSTMPQEFGLVPMKTMPPRWMSVIIQTDMASPCLLCSPHSDRRLMFQNNCFTAPFISLPKRGRASCLDLKGSGFYEMAPLFGIHFPAIMVKMYSQWKSRFLALWLWCFTLPTVAVFGLGLVRAVVWFVWSAIGLTGL